MLDFNNSATVYVSATEGSDAYSGFAPHPGKGNAGPLRTLRRALDLVTSLHIPGEAQPVLIRVSGDHYLSAPLEIGGKDRFADADYIPTDLLIESYGDTPARLIGGRRLEGFAPDTFNGVACISLHIPEVESGAWHFTDLYVNGRRAEAARYPREGTLRAVDTEHSDATRLGDGSRWFIAHREDLAGIDGIENATVSFYHYWVDEHSPVESYDPDTGKLVMQYRSRFRMTVNYGKNDTSEFCYYLENIAAGFGAPNSWYLDVPRGMLYYVPADPAATVESLEVFAPMTERLFHIHGAPGRPIRGIRLRGLELLCSKGDYASKTGNPGAINDEGGECLASDSQSVAGGFGAVLFEYAENCSIEDCRLYALGLHAIQIARGSCGVRVERCLIEEIGGGGVKLYGGKVGDAEEDAVTHCVIRANTIRYVGRRYAAACGILACHTSFNEIAENDISYTDYTGISVGWIWGYYPSSTYGNRIVRNHVHHIGVGLLSDMAGIYLLGAQHGTVVSDNYVHDVKSSHYGGHGIYTDEGSSYITIERNVVANCRSNCFYQHYGAYNTVRDNVFAFGDHGVVAIGKYEGHLGAVLEGNTIITAKGQKAYHEYNPNAVTSTLRASRNTFFEVGGGEPTLFVRRTAEGVEELSLAAWQAEYGTDTESRIAEPQDLIIDADACTVTRKNA